MTSRTFTDEDHRKHLEFLQAAITCMAANQLQVNQWVAPMVGALMAYAVLASAGMAGEAP